MRHHVHIALTAENIADRNGAITVSIDASDDQEAQEFVMDLLPDLEFDVTEIEAEE